MSSGKHNGFGLWPYRIILLAISPLVLIYTLYRCVKDGGSLYLRQRFGFSLPAKTKNAIWIHCASVGEVNTALPLIRALITKQPHKRFIVSTTTPTGKQVLLKQTGKDLIHFYLPIDFNSTVKRSLKKIAPQKLILVETEIWPNLIEHCNSSKISIVIVNARLSAKSMDTYAWLRSAYAESLNKIDAVFAKSKNEGENFLRLGLPPKNLHIVGSLKFAAVEIDKNTTNLQLKPYCLAVSTHSDEELRIVSEWKKQNCEVLLVIAPRYPERRDLLQKQLNMQGVTVQLRSQQSTLKPDTQVYIADTLGEVNCFIQKALVVFVGGSLIPRGGHNIIEAARAGKAVITGSSIENFRDEFQWLSDQAAIVQVDNEKELVKQMCELLDDEQRRAELGNNARRACASQNDVIDRYVSLLSLHS